MAKKHREILARLDAIGIRRYRITEQDVQEVEEYLRIIQKGFKGGSTWQEVVQYGGPYATSIIIHEIVEIFQLRARGFDPFQESTTDDLRALVVGNIDVHVVATYEEHLYLQEVIYLTLGQRFEVATLIRANRGDDEDLELFLESDVGVYFMEEERVEEAARALDRLKGEVER